MFHTKKMKNVKLLFAERLVEICEEKGLKPYGRQAALARVFGISQPGVKRWFDGETLPEIEKMIEIALWANVNFEWLSTGRGEKRPGSSYKTNAIANVVKVMEQMDVQQQYLVARLADQVAKPVANEQNMSSDTNNLSNGTGGKR